MSVSEKQRTTPVYLRTGCATYQEYSAVRALTGMRARGYPCFLAKALVDCGYSSLRVYAERLAMNLGWRDLSDFVENSYWLVRKANAYTLGLELENQTIWKKGNSTYEGVQGKSKEKKLALHWLIHKTRTTKPGQGAMLTQVALARQAGMSRQLFSIYARGEGLPEGKHVQQLLRVLAGGFETLDQVLCAYHQRLNTKQELPTASELVHEQEAVLC